jgi:hypothetical protein
MNIKSSHISSIMSKIHTNTKQFCSFIYIYKEPHLMPCNFFCSQYRQLCYDTVVTVTLCWHHRRWLMQYVTAPLSQNKLILLQQSATLNNIALQIAVEEIYRLYQSFNLLYYSTARNIRINRISLNGQLSRYSDWLRAGRSGDRGPLGANFLYLLDRGCGPASLLYKGYLMTPGSNAAGTWCWPHTSSSPEVKERVEWYNY